MTQIQNTWSKFPNNLFAREDITPLAKLIYVHMLHKYQFFVVREKQQYYETQEQIAKACGVGRTATNDAIQKLINLGWLDVRKHKRQGNAFNNIYTVKDVFGVYQKEVKSPKVKKLFDPFEDTGPF